MKKAISLFLALSVLCFATSAMAATNSINPVDDAPRNDVTKFGSAYNSASMPGFRPGDTLSFNLSALTVSNELTVISYKYNETLSDSTVQYINQYTVDSASKTIAYTIRNLDSGVYVLKFNDDADEVATFYYKVGKATVELVQSQNSTVSAGTLGTPYRKQQINGDKWSIGFIGKVTIDSTEVSLADIGAKPGFTVTNTVEGTSAKSYFGQSGNKTVANLDDTALEISGSYSFIFGVTVHSVTNGQQNNIKASVSLDN